MTANWAVSVCPTHGSASWAPHGPSDDLIVCALAAETVAGDAVFVAFVD